MSHKPDSKEELIKLKFGRKIDDVLNHIWHIIILEITKGYDDMAFEDYVSEDTLPELSLLFDKGVADAMNEFTKFRRFVKEQEKALTMSEEEKKNREFSWASPTKYDFTEKDETPLDSANFMIRLFDKNRHTDWFREDTLKRYENIADRLRNLYK